MAHLKGEKIYQERRRNPYTGAITIHGPPRRTLEGRNYREREETPYTGAHTIPWPTRALSRGEECESGEHPV